jgi:hypothetical protein
VKDADFLLVYHFKKVRATLVVQIFDTLARKLVQKEDFKNVKFEALFKLNYVVKVDRETTRFSFALER